MSENPIVLHNYINKLYNSDIVIRYLHRNSLQFQSFYILHFQKLFG